MSKAIVVIIQIAWPGTSQVYLHHHFSYRVSPFILPTAGFRSSCLSLSTLLRTCSSIHHKSNSNPHRDKSLHGSCLRLFLTKLQCLSHGSWFPVSSIQLSRPVRGCRGKELLFWLLWQSFSESLSESPVFRLGPSSKPSSKPQQMLPVSHSSGPTSMQPRI